MIKNNNYITSLKGSFGKYFSATIFSAIVGMLMNKYYTYAFTVEEYGVLSLYLTFITYLQSIITFSMDSSWGRLYFDYKDKKKNFFSTVINFSLVSISFWMIVLAFAQEYIQNILGGTTAIYWCSIIAVSILAFVKICNLLSTLENEATLVRSQTMLQSILNNLVAVIFILLNFGIISRIIGNVWGSLCNLFFYIKHLRKKDYLQYGFSFDKSIFSKLQPFFLSTFFNTTVIATLSYMDRVLLNTYHGAAQVGIYSIGVLIGQGISMVSEACSMALFPAIINNLSDNYTEGILQLKKMDNIFWVIYMLLFIAVFFSKELLVLIFSNDNYLTASGIIPLVVLGYISGALYKNVMGVLSYHKIVWKVSLLGIVAYAIGAYINFLLIPDYAEKGAALALLLSSLTYSFFLHYMSRKYYFGIVYIVVRHFIIGILGLLLFYYCF